jgi:hypothetical protein
MDHEGARRFTDLTESYSADWWGASHFSLSGFLYYVLYLGRERRRRRRRRNVCDAGLNFLFYIS